jgi:hypothetical protein
MNKWMQNYSVNCKNAFNFEHESGGSTNTADFPWIRDHYILTYSRQIWRKSI